MIQFIADSVQTTCSTCHAVEIAAAVTGIIVLVVGVLVGFLPGILVYHCISKHCSLSSKPGHPSTNSGKQAQFMKRCLQRSLN